MKATLTKKSNTQEPVAIIYCGHIIFKGRNGESIYLTGDKSCSPPPNFAFVHSKKTWEESVQEAKGHEYPLIYPGDTITIEF